jgi:hypothetical protein
LQLKSGVDTERDKRPRISRVFADNKLCHGKNVAIIINMRFGCRYLGRNTYSQSIQFTLIYTLLFPSDLVKMALRSDLIKTEKLDNDLSLQYV